MSRNVIFSVCVCLSVSGMGKAHLELVTSHTFCVAWRSFMMSRKPLRLSYSYRIVMMSKFQNEFIQRTLKKFATPHSYPIKVLKHDLMPLFPLNKSNVCMLQPCM